MVCESLGTDQALCFPRFKPLTVVCYWMNRVGAFVLLIPGALTLATLAVKGVLGSIKSLQVSGVFGVASLPLAMGLTYLMYVAPLSRIPAALAAAWRGDRDATLSPPPIKVRASV